MQAMNEELVSLELNDTWDIVPKSSNRKVKGPDEYIRSNISQMVTLRDSKLGWWLRVTLKLKALTMLRPSPQLQR